MSEGRTALVGAVFAFVQTYYDAVVQGESVLMVDSYTLLVPLIILLFAELYKTARLAAVQRGL